MTTDFEQVDEFFVITEDHDKDHIARYEWICSSDLSEYHSCNSGWKYLSHGKDRHGDFDGVVYNQCEQCGEKFKSHYSECVDNPEIINRKDFESGNW